MTKPSIIFSSFVALAVAGSFCTPRDAEARQAGQFYLQIGGGGVFTNKSSTTTNYRDNTVTTPTGPYNPCELWERRVQGATTDETAGCGLKGDSSYNPGFEVEGGLGYYLTSQLRWDITIGYRNFTPDKIDLSDEALIYALHGSEFYGEGFADNNSGGVEKKFFGDQAKAPAITYDGFAPNDVLAQYRTLTATGATAAERAAAAIFIANARNAYQSEFVDNLTLYGVTVTTNFYWDPQVRIANRNYRQHHPFIGVGVGVVIWDIEFDGDYGHPDFLRAGVGDVVDPTPSLTLNASAGYNYHVNRYISLGAFYRFNWVGSARLDTKGRFGSLHSDIELDDLFQHNVMATITFHYDGFRLRF